MKHAVKLNFYTHLGSTSIKYNRSAGRFTRRHAAVPIDGGSEVQRRMLSAESVLRSSAVLCFVGISSGLGVELLPSQNRCSSGRRAHWSPAGGSLTHADGRRSTALKSMKSDTVNR